MYRPSLCHFQWHPPCVCLPLCRNFPFYKDIINMELGSNLMTYFQVRLQFEVLGVKTSVSFLGETQFSPEQEVNRGLTELVMILRANNRIPSSHFKQK